MSELIDEKYANIIDLDYNAIKEWMDGHVECDLCEFDENTIDCGNHRCPTNERMLLKLTNLEAIKVDYNNVEHHVSDEKIEGVDSPSHYCAGKYESIDVIDEFTKDLVGVESSYTFNILKYVMRWKKKNGIQDLKKARYYINRLIDHLEKCE